MDLRDIAAACGRRWYVLVLVVVLFGWLVVDQRAQARPVYTVDTLLSVLPAPTLAGERDGAGGQAVAGDTNPFGSPATVALYLSEASGEGTGDPDGVQISWNGLQPTLLSVTVVADDPAAAALSGAGATVALQNRLRDLQDGQSVAPSDRFVLLPGVPVGEPVRTVPPVGRMTVVLCASGLLAGLTVATALDVAVRRRRTPQ